MGSGGNQRPPFQHQPPNQTQHHHFQQPLHTQPAPVPHMQQTQNQQQILHQKQKYQQGQQPFHQTTQQQHQQQQQQQQQQHPQIVRPSIPNTNLSAADQNLNLHFNAANIATKANSRESSSSGGNASVAQSTGAGSIGGGQAGPSPTGTKQEQRLTHEQVCIILLLII